MSEIMLNEAGVKEALAKLGDDWKEVAANLGVMECQGEPGHPEDCPLGVYLTRLFDSRSAIALSGVVVWPAPGKEPVVVASPRAVKDFIHEFDDGNIPSLIGPDASIPIGWPEAETHGLDH